MLAESKFDILDLKKNTDITHDIIFNLHKIHQALKRGKAVTSERTLLVALLVIMSSSCE